MKVHRFLFIYNTHCPIYCWSHLLVCKSGLWLPLFVSPKDGHVTEFFWGWFHACPGHLQSLTMIRIGKQDTLISRGNRILRYATECVAYFKTLGEKKKFKQKSITFNKHYHKTNSAHSFHENLWTQFYIILRWQVNIIYWRWYYISLSLWCLFDASKSIATTTG